MLATCLLPLLLAPCPALPAALPAVQDPALQTADAASEIQSALKKSAEENRRVLIQWGAEWCGWCRKLHELMKSDAALRRKLLYEYDVVEVDVGHLDQNMGLAAKYGADLERAGIPYLTVLDPSGAVLASLETGQFEAGKEEAAGHDPKKLLAELEKHQAKYAKAQELLNATLASAKKTDRRVFLKFGAPWCGWCHKLDSVLEQESVAAALAKDFVIRKIDTERTLGGAEMLERFRGSESGGIPWFVILEPGGRPVVHSSPGGENLGCPYTEEEVAAYEQILRKAARHMSPEDIQTVIAAQNALRKKDELQNATE